MSNEPEKAEDGVTDDRFLLATTDGQGARDPIALVSQLKYMRERFKHIDPRPALILVVVPDGEHEAATIRIAKTLAGDATPAQEIS